MYTKFFIVMGLVFSFIHSGSSQEISMFPALFGYKYYEDSEKVSRYDFESMIQFDDINNKAWKKYKTHRSIAAATFATGIALAFIEIYPDNDVNNNILYQIGSIVSLGAYIGFTISSQKNQRKAILRYNEHSDLSEIHLGLSSNGIGLVYTF